MLSSSGQYEHIINIRNGWTKFSGREGGVNVLVNLFPQTVTIKHVFPYNTNPFLNADGGFPEIGWEMWTLSGLIAFS